MIKYPGGDLALWTLLFLVAGTFVTYDSFASGKTGMGFVFATLPVGCALIWLDVREAKWLVVAYLALATFGAIIALSSQGFSWSMALRGSLAALGVFEFARWDGNPEAC